MMYQIPNQNIEKLTKKINRIINKGAPITFEIGGDCLIPYQVDGIYDINGRLVNFYVKGKEVNVEGTYIINGWQFVATLEHKENGNIIRCADSSFEGRIPEMYRTCAPHCDHCNQLRNRKDTYLIYNESTKEFKQVGKSCLMEYTCGLDAEVCADICTSLFHCENACEITSEMRTPTNTCCSSNLVKKIAYAYVKKNGYKSGETTREIASLIFGRSDNNVATKEELDKVNAWVESLDANNDYLKNAKVAWESNYSEYRDIALIASLINTYFKELVRLEKLSHENNSYVGNVGDKIVFKVASKRVLYSKGKYAYYGDEVYMYELHNEQGQTILWSTSAFINVGDIIQAKIKSLGEYKGAKQTIITRGTILYHSDKDCGIQYYESDAQEKEAHNSAREALDKFLAQLD